MLCVELGQVAAAEHRYLQCFACGFGPTREYYQTRNLARYERLHIDLQNRTHTALRCAVQVKDYRDSKGQNAPIGSNCRPPRRPFRSRFRWHSTCRIMLCTD